MIVIELELLENRYGNTQQTIVAHMNAPVKMSSVDKEDLSGFRILFGDVTSHVRSLVNLRVENRTYGSILCLIILEKLWSEVILIISWNNNINDFNFTRILDLINVELKAREACVVQLHTPVEGKNDFGFSSPIHTPYVDLSLVSAGS